MSANTVELANDNRPVPVSGERFSSVDDVGFELLSGTGYPGTSGNFYSSSAKAYSSNLRIVIVPGRQSPQFSSFSIPLYNVQEPKLSLPRFGKPCVKAEVLPVDGFGMPTKGKLILLFGNKQSAKGFMELFEESLEQAQRCRMFGGSEAVGHSIVANPRQPAPLRPLDRVSVAENFVNFIAQPYPASAEHPQAPLAVAANPAQRQPEHSLSSAYVDPNEPTMLFLPSQQNSAVNESVSQPQQARPSVELNGVSSTSTTALRNTSSSISDSQIQLDLPSSNQSVNNSIQFVPDIPYVTSSASQVVANRQHRVPNVAEGANAPLLQNNDVSSIDWPEVPESRHRTTSKDNEKTLLLG